jgi:restriction system protein
VSLWLIRAGAGGEREDLALDQGLAVIGWHELPGLSSISARSDLENLYRATFPDAGRGLVANHVGQLWAFVNRIQVGDFVVLPLKRRAAIAVGEITGPYQHRPDLPEDARHTRPVNWLAKDVPRSRFDQDLLYSLGAFMTVCQIQRNNAEARIRALIGGHAQAGQPNTGTSEESLVAPGEPPPNLEEFARDEIIRYIDQRFRGHKLADLVGAILEAEGYQVRQSPPGRDGGVDLLADRGPLGFEPPRLCVQVKSSDAPVDVGVLRELQGVMTNFGAQQGLLVAWGGFKQSVHNEARQLFFAVRLWDQGRLVQALLDHYDALSAELQAELPLKRIWSLVREE